MKIERIFLAMVLLVAASVRAAGETQGGEASALPPYSVFAMPQLHSVHKRLAGEFKQAMSKGDYIAMERICEQAVKTFPEDPTWCYNLACSYARRGKPHEATAVLGKAVMLGFTDSAQISADTDLATLRRDTSFARVLEMVQRLRDYISAHFYNCTKDILSGLGKMYASGNEFTENIDKAGGKGTAEFVSKAVEEYCK